jgi:hypothetical protein
MIYAKSLHGQWAENRELLSFIHSACWVLISPFGLIVQANLERSGIDVCLFVIVIAANSAFWGLVLAWIIRRLFPRLTGNTPQHPTQHVPQRP